MAWPGSARSGTSRAPPFMPRARRRRAPSRQRRPRRAAAQAQRRRRGVARRHPRRPRAIPVDRRRTPEGLGQAACDRWRAVSRKRLLRLMREHGLLSPHRARTRSDAPHDRRIVTEAPNVMWATDATQIVTVQDGKVWLFGVAEHWNAELLGWHVAKRDPLRSSSGRRHGGAKPVRPRRRRRRPRPGAAA